ncbi:hypothetical protein H4Q32_030007 [Labeo rohita]|uniref:Uncharacterized protein n=1 Tax=Labeo rohita TaxID=84645 RepID=A0ABQ8L3T9_LABRO|nr:hypothetical protein H4Q32_030007 [Labeo rohita]
MFKSSTCSLWPIRCVINELQPNVRFKNIKTCRCLGVVWNGFTHLRKQLWCLRFFPVICSCDAVARCALQGIHQFNGAYGYGHCLNERQTVPKGRGYARVYSPTEAQKRTHGHVIECGQRAIENDVDHVFGVKTVSPLVLLNPSTGFDIVNSFSIDYMHCALLGVTKQFLDLWFNSKYHDSPWYIGTSHKHVDQRLLTADCESNAKVEGCRMPKLAIVLQWACSVQDSSNKISETLATSDTITENEWAAATSKIKFVQEIPTTYGLCQMSFNVHQLTHLPFSVKMYGPLWCTSAFSFEGHNQKLKRLCHGTNYIPSQIARQFNMLQSIPQLLKQTMTSADVSNRVDKLVNDWLEMDPFTWSDRASHGKRRLQKEQNYGPLPPSMVGVPVLVVVRETNMLRLVTAFVIGTLIHVIWASNWFDFSNRAMLRNMRLQHQDRFVAVSLLHLCQCSVCIFFCLENKHLNNCSEFRAVRDVSVSSLNADDQTLLEQKMKQKDHVRNRLRKKNQKSP